MKSIVRGNWINPVEPSFDSRLLVEQSPLQAAFGLGMAAMMQEGCRLPFTKKLVASSESLIVLPTWDVAVPLN